MILSPSSYGPEIYIGFPSRPKVSSHCPSGVVFGPVLDRRVAFVRHADRVVLVTIARHYLLQRDLVLPAGAEVVRVADVPARRQHIPHPDRAFVCNHFQVYERVVVLFLPRPEYVQVIAVPAEQHQDDLVQVGEGGGDRQADRRQIGGREPDSETFSSATWSMLRRAGGAELRHLPRECRGIRVTGGPHLGEARVQVRPRHALPDAAERLVRALVLKRGSRVLDVDPSSRYCSLASRSPPSWLSRAEPVSTPSAPTYTSASSIP